MFWPKINATIKHHIFCKFNKNPHCSSLQMITKERVHIDGDKWTENITNEYPITEGLLLIFIIINNMVKKMNPVLCISRPETLSRLIPR